MLNTTEIDERIEKCEKILKENPQSQVFAALADALRKKGELDHAFRVSRQGLRLHPDYAPGRLVMAKISFDRRMYDWAEQELKEAIDLDGRTRSTDLLEIEILIQSGFYSKAKVILDKLRSSDPTNEFYRSLEERIAAGKAEKKAKLAETEEFYRAKSREKKADAFDSLVDSGWIGEPITYDVALKLISNFPNIEGAFFTSLDGMVDQTQVPDGFDVDAYSASLTEICRFITPAVGAIGLENCIEVLVETENRKFILILLGDRILVASCRSDVNLGSLKLKLAKITESLRKE
jgi:predicted regulator of Ras-like GTPase activity (Roadblock/LC7/MglB family)